MGANDRYEAPNNPNFRFLQQVNRSIKQILTDRHRTIKFFTTFSLAISTIEQTGFSRPETTEKIEPSNDDTESSLADDTAYHVHILTKSR